MGHVFLQHDIQKSASSTHASIACQWPAYKSEWDSEVPKAIWLIRSLPGVPSLPSWRFVRKTPKKSLDWDRVCLLVEMYCFCFQKARAGDG